MSPFFLAREKKNQKLFEARGLYNKTMVMQNHQASKNLTFKILFAEIFTIL
jgi:hypothetical protein